MQRFRQDQGISACYHSFPPERGRYEIEARDRGSADDLPPGRGQRRRAGQCRQLLLQHDDDRLAHRHEQRDDAADRRRPGRRRLAGDAAGLRLLLHGRPPGPLHRQLKRHAPLRRRRRSGPRSTIRSAQAGAVADRPPTAPTSARMPATARSTSRSPARRRTGWRPSSGSTCSRTSTPAEPRTSPTRSRLFETTGTIEFVYGSMSMSAAGAADANSQSPQYRLLLEQQRGGHRRLGHRGPERHAGADLQRRLGDSGEQPLRRRHDPRPHLRRGRLAPHLPVLLAAAGRPARRTANLHRPSRHRHDRSTGRTPRTRPATRSTLDRRRRHLHLRSAPRPRTRRPSSPPACSLHDLLLEGRGRVTRGPRRRARRQPGHPDADAEHLGGHRPLERSGHLVAGGVPTPRTR